MRESKTDRPTAIDLFCGCGGLTAGLKRAGFRVIGAVDIDPLSVKTYKLNHRGIRVWKEDIRILKPPEMLEMLNLKKGELDLLAGCPPCQGFSRLRTLNGFLTIEDGRNDLLFEFQRFVGALKPRAIMVENVPGLAKDERFKRFSSAMSKLGYLGDHRILNAADYGVPQRRRRLIYLAGRGFKIPFAEPFDKRITVRDAFAELAKAGESGDPVHDMPEHRSSRIMTLIRRIPKDGGGRLDLSFQDQLPCHQMCEGFKDIYGRIAWDRISPTITSGCFNPSKGRFLHPQEDRAITIREAALLQGFPPRYKFPAAGGKLALARMIGNALPPPFIDALARSIAQTLEPINDNTKMKIKRTELQP